MLIPEQQYRLSEAAGNHARQAIFHLARAAACEELIVDGSHSEGQLWFLMRAMCAEHGLNPNVYVESARADARRLATTE